MCGIAGILRPSGDRQALKAELEGLRRSLVHRGPDDSGIELVGSSGVAHTRLSILDRSPLGAQPMWSPARDQVLVYNGEVYNFRTLRAELEAEGEPFRGGSDTEVVLRVLARQGVEGLSRFDGMFALAALDARGQSALLARDRVGQKPLYLARLSGGGWAFASELAPLLALPGVDTALDLEALSHVLTLGFAPAPYTLRRGVRQLEPGSWVRLHVDREPESGRFVSPPGPREPTRAGDAASLVEPLEETLSRCVAEHLISDVPVGVLLSGGVDSATIAALAARHTGRVKTFTVVHRDPAYDESDVARRVAHHIGSDHHEIEVSDSPLTEEELDVLVDHHGDPFADSSSLNVLRLTRQMKQHVSVALSGDGGDEVFAGYPRFTILRDLEWLARVPRPLTAGLAALGARVPGRRARQASRLLDLVGQSPGRRQVAYFSLFWPEEQAEILQPERIPRRPGDAFETLLRERGCELEADPVASAHWQEQRMLLPDNMLTKVDRMSMVPAVEVRPPLLAGPVLDLAARMPFAAKHRGREGKRVLRRLAQRLVPPEVTEGPKKGFALPLEEYGGRVFSDAFGFAVDSEASPLREIFRPDALASLSTSLRRSGEGRDPEDSPYRRVHRRWLLTLLARTLDRQGVGA